MTELVRWDGASRDVVDGWVNVLVEVEQLSRIIAGTDFVPAALRGKPAAVGAAILAGRELGIGPMTALQHLHVIDGRPSMSAQLMRALVYGHGHRIRIVESTSTRCVMAGRRVGEEDETVVAYTLDDAHRAKLDGRPNWQKMPRAMLAARATGELCRLAFADVIGGMAYTAEEAADVDGDDVEPVTAPPPTKRPRRIVARATPVRAHEPDPVDPDPDPVIADPDPVVADPEPETAEPQPEPAADPLASDEQTRKLFALMGESGVAEPRERRIQVTQALIARRVESFAQLTAREASSLIDTLTRVQSGSGGDPDVYLQWLVESGLDHLRLVESSDVEPPDAVLLDGPWEDPPL